MDEIQVLLSAYNGEKYIFEQIQSIFEQKDVSVSCLVRDDGSKDETCRIIEKLSYPDLKLVRGDHQGWKKGFYETVYLADEVPFYAFADQDDVWKNWKLKRAVDCLKKYPQEIPGLYYSNVTITDEELNVLGTKKNMIPPAQKVSSLNICYGQGCTMVFNYAAKKLFMRYRVEEPISHECWMSILCVFFGNIVYDDRETMFYRQHGSNDIGAHKKNKIQLLRDRLTLRNSSKVYFPYYRYLLEGYEDMLGQREKEILYDFVNYQKKLSSKIRLLTNPAIKRYTLGGTLALKLAILENRI